MSRLPKLVLGWVTCFCNLPSSEATAVIASLPLFKIGVLLSAGLWSQRLWLQKAEEGRGRAKSGWSSYIIPVLFFFFLIPVHLTYNVILVLVCKGVIQWFYTLLSASPDSVPLNPHSTHPLVYLPSSNHWFLLNLPLLWVFLLILNILYFTINLIYNMLLKNNYQNSSIYKYIGEVVYISLSFATNSFKEERTETQKW